MKKPIFLIFLLALSLLSTDVFAGWDEGVAAFTQKNYRTAASEFQKILRQSPNSFAAHYMLGLSYEKLKKEQQALRHLEKALDLSSDVVNIKVALGRIYFKVNKFKKAIKISREAIKEEPRNIEAHKFLGLSLERVKKKKEALTHLRKAYDLSRDISVQKAIKKLGR